MIKCYKVRFKEDFEDHQIPKGTELYAYDKSGYVSVLYKPDLLIHFPTEKFEYKRSAASWYFYDKMRWDLHLEIIETFYCKNRRELKSMFYKEKEGWE